jgi:hypothetical protein
VVLGKQAVVMSSSSEDGRIPLIESATWHRVLVHQSKPHVRTRTLILGIPRRGTPGVVLKLLPDSNETFSWRVSCGRRAAKPCSSVVDAIVGSLEKMKSQARDLPQLAERLSLRPRHIRSEVR